MVICGNVSDALEQRVNILVTLRMAERFSNL